MRNQHQIKPVVAGAFLLLSVALIIVVVFTIGLEKGFTEPKFTMTALFHKVGGLMVGAPVRISGVTVGTVADIGFLEREVSGRGVKVTMQIFRKYEKQVHKITTIAIETEGVLGQKIVEIGTGERVHIEDLKASFIGSDPIDAADIAHAFDDTAAALTRTTEKIDGMLDYIGEISRTTKRLLQRIEQRVIDGNLFKVF